MPKLTPPIPVGRRDHYYIRRHIFHLANSYCVFLFGHSKPNAVDDFLPALAQFEREFSEWSRDLSVNDVCASFPPALIPNIRFPLPVNEEGTSHPLPQSVATVVVAAQAELMRRQSRTQAPAAQAQANAAEIISILTTNLRGVPR